MSNVRDIDRAVDGLDSALRAAGFPGLEGPGDRHSLDEVAEAVAPFELPAELRRFWERVDPTKFVIDTFPELVGPASALELRLVPERTQVTAPAMPPPTFLVFGYSSHVHRSIELSSRWGKGGTIIRWAWDELPFQIAYRSLSALVNTVAELVAEGRLERAGGFVYIPEAAEREKQLVHLAQAGPHPLYADAREIPGELESWPAHWLEASGIDLGDRVPLGATHTIAALVAAASRAPVTGRIHGTVIRLVGIGGDVLAVVDDGTRALDVWCPAGTSPWGPASEGRFEFEVTIEGPVGAPPDLDTGHAEISGHALAGRLEAAQEAAERFFGGVQARRASAVATDIRPLDH